MKKQFLLLIVVFMASISMVVGQALPGSLPRGSVCKDDFLHPVPGKAYDYTVTTDPTGGNYRWWATKNPNFIVNSAISASDSLKESATQIAAASANYGTLGTSNTVTITWSSALLAATKYQGTPGTAPDPTFVAVHYVAPSGSCADNLKVYELDPINAFTVDIKNIEDGAKTILGYDATEAQCVDDVSSAKYVSGKMEYLYGHDTLYYEVVAANFTGSYTPLFKLTGLNAVQTSVIQWTYDAPSTWTTATVWHAATDAVTTTVNTDKGVSIYVRVAITNNNFETIAAQAVKLAVDGSITIGGSTIWDIDNGAGDLCVTTTGADEKDFADQTINPRPKITGTASPITTNINIIPGNEQN